MYGQDEFEFYVAEYSVDEVRQDLARLVKFFQEQDYHERAMQMFLVDYREMPMEVAIESDAFCVNEEMEIWQMPDWFQSEPLGFIRNKWCTQWGRCVFPVKDVRGQVAGLCGWDPFAQPKYLDSRNYGYKAKQTMLYGMEKLPEYYVAKGPVFLTEGLMCTWYLRWKKFMALSSLGSYLTPYVIQILRRFGDRLIVITDNDDTGDKYAKQVKYSCPKARVMQVAFGKDIDGCRRFEEHKYEELLLKDLHSVSNPFVKTEILIQR